MYMSVTQRRANAFKRWSERRQPPSNDDANGLVRVDALALAAFGNGSPAVRVATASLQRTGGWKLSDGAL